MNCNEIINENKILKENLELAEKILKDLSKYGLKMDLNPTHMLGDYIQSEIFWHGYIKDADNYVRNIANDYFNMKKEVNDIG